jgi:hypothetical protein
MRSASIIRAISHRPHDGGDYAAGPHDVTSQKTAGFKLIAVEFEAWQELIFSFVTASEFFDLHLFFRPIC